VPQLILFVSTFILHFSSVCVVGGNELSVVVSVTSDEEASDVCESGYTVVVVTPEPTTVVEVGSGVGGRRLMPLESCAAAAERVLPARPTRSADGRISECMGCSTCFVGSKRCFKRASGRQQENSSWAKGSQTGRVVELSITVTWGDGRRRRHMGRGNSGMNI